MSLRRYLRRRKWDEERARELEAHLEQETADNVARGMKPVEARRHAFMKLGNPTMIREEIWKMNSLVSVEDLARDTRYALRQLWKSPGFAVIAIVTLALGIGVNTAIFSMVNGLLFSSLHVREENRMMEIGSRQKATQWQPQFSLVEYQAMQSQTKDVFSSVIGDAYGLDGLSVEGNKPDRVFTDYVGGDFFTVLGVEPSMGRLFHPGEGTTPGKDPVVVLSYGYWKQHFAADPNIVGRQVQVDGHAMTVIGVTARNYRGLNTALEVQMYLPMAMIVPLENVPMTEYNKPTNRNLRVYGRLKPGVTKEQANATLMVVAKRIAADQPVADKDLELGTFALWVGRNAGFDPQNAIGTVALFMLGLAGMVLLLACVNVANLLLVRATVREREMVIRSALGAARGRLIRQMLTESLMLAVCGGAAGIALGTWWSHLLTLVNLGTDLPLRLDFGFDWHVFAFSAVVAIVAGALVGIVPAIRLARANLNMVLREGGRGVAGGGHRFRDALVIMQVGSVMVLLIVAGLFLRSLRQSEHAELGFNPENVLTMMMDPGEIGYNDARSQDFYKLLVERVEAVPGVRSATVAQVVPMGLIGNGPAPVTIPGFEPPPGQPGPLVDNNLIQGDYFETLGIGIAQGRRFNDGDDQNRAYVAIVSEAMAKKYWPHGDAIGRRFTINSDPAHSLEIVGIARDARYHGYRQPMEPYFYVPFAQHNTGNSLEALEVRTAGDPAAMMPALERTINGMAPNLPLFEVKTMHQALYSPNGLLVFEIIGTLAGIMGSMGLVLAVVGVYGVLSYVVSQRTSEIGIRMALGAQRGDILRIVYRQGMWIVGIGLAVGLAASFGVAHLVGSMITVSPSDPLTFLGVAVTLTSIALLACYVPARRAMYVEPMKALRND
jgi:predicted permease